MKEIKIDNELKSDPALLAQIDQITRLLEDEVGPAASAIRPEWRMLDRRGEHWMN